MSSSQPRVAVSLPGAHAAVRSRRLEDFVRVAVAGLLALVIALGITVAVPNPNYLLLIAGVLGVVGIGTLVTTARLEVTVPFLALYLGLLGGPVKLGLGAHELGSAMRDVLIVAVSLGALLRLVVRKEPVRLPPMFAWVLAFVALVVVEAFNPKTLGLLKVLGGFRQQLEWVPFFFFGYLIMRSKGRFRRLFLILGVLALANGAVATYQTRLSPPQLASWGPGYRELVFGGAEGLSGRTFASEGEAHVRPPGLGTDAGFGGGVGVLALPGAVALVAMTRGRRRWMALILCLGALVAIATSLGRIQVVGAVIALTAFALLSAGSGRRMTRPLAALLGILALTIPLGAVFVSAVGSSTFSRYESISPGKLGSTGDTKQGTLFHIPAQAEAAPFGVGLATVGAVGGFGGTVAKPLEGHSVSADTQYNFVLDELGIFGLILWVALSLNVIALAARGLRRIADSELRVYLSAAFASFIAFTIIGVSGPTMGSAAFGPYFWFAVGMAAYWFADPGRRRAAISRSLA
jgi:hypothetical protein